MTEPTEGSPSAAPRGPTNLAQVQARMLASARARARASKVPFNITAEDLQFPAYCPALGIPIIVGADKASDNSPSLDKVIPALGYVRGNIVVVSNRANRAKNNLTVGELRLLADFYESFVRDLLMKPAT